MVRRKEAGPIPTYVLSCFENSRQHTDLRRNAAAYDIRIFICSGRSFILLEESSTRSDVADTFVGVMLQTEAHQVSPCPRSFEI
jgi:hypothetical protein